MGTYTVKAPDGKTITLQGPDGASQADIIAQAQRLYQPQATPKPAAVNPFLNKYTSIRNGLAAKFANDPAKQQQALTRFDSDSRVQLLRQKAGLAPLSTAQQEVQKTAKRALSAPVQALDDVIRLMANGATFGFADKFARAMGEQDTAEKTQAAQQRAGIVAPVADITGSVLSMGGIGKGVAALAKSAVPAAARVGNVLQEIGTLRKGQKLVNAGKIATIGAAAGGAQAAGTDQNIPTGAAEGAVVAPAAVLGLKLGQVVTRPFRDVLRLSSAGQILSRLTSASRSALEARAAAYRDATGAEPTLFELLPLTDRNKILKQGIVGKDNIVEQTSKAIRDRAQNLGPEMSARAQQILTPARNRIHAQLRSDIATARGGALAPGDETMIANAMESPTDMLHLRDEEARAIMAPHETTPVVANLGDLFPHVPGPNGTRVGTDPEVAAVIRSASGTLRARPANAGITAGDITDMISTLKGDLGRGGIEGRTAERAIGQLQDVLDTNAPEAGAAAKQMSDAYSARSRMAEGMQEGAATRLRNDVQVGTSRRQARTVRNAYDTSEGTAGRSLGQGNRILSDLGGSSEEALRATVKQSRGSTGRALEQNVGSPEADQLVTAARAQDESAQALASASAKAQSGSGEGADAEMLVQAIAGLHPSSFITTKSNAVRKLLDMTYIPESRARTMVDMVFSQDPAMRTRALRAIGNEPNGATFLKYLAGASGQLAAGVNGPDAQQAPESDVLTNPVLTQPPADADGAVDANAEAPTEAQETPATPADGASQSPYAPVLHQIYQNENPDLIDLVQRVKNQEHGTDAHGNFLTSPAGAIGPMQVMPATGPEAARLAGLPWDEKAYRSDAAYNEVIGIAYLSQLLRKYKGDVARALAAYNAGTGRVDDALTSHGTKFLSAMPAETQDYVARVGQ